MKILKVANSDDLSSYDLEPISKIEPEWLAYYYKREDYEGSGFAVWMKKQKFYYTELGHCSCYGPTENINSIAYDSLEEIEVFASNYNCGQEVISLVRKEIYESNRN